MSTDEPDAPGDGANQGASEDVDAEVTTVHRKDGHDQVTERSVRLDDGDLVELFEVVDGEHEYVGDGNPDQRAIGVLEARF